MKFKKNKTKKIMKKNKIRKSKTFKKNISLKKRLSKIKLGGEELDNDIESQILPAVSTFNKKDKATIIGNFMITNRDKIKSIFLKTICSDSGLCIAFGVESEKIKQFFNNFTSGEYIKLPINRIGNISKNGFVNTITYERENYKANTVLKSNIDTRSDNLYYEYMVGKFINKWNIVFPCFLETYGLFKYNNNEDWSFVKDNTTIDTNILNTKLMYIKEPTVTESCSNALYLALLIQHINKANTLFETIKERIKDNAFKFELVNILYQIYMPLSAMSNIFTHYDLHPNNILLYEPVKNNYIQYYYHSVNHELQPIEFKSRYIVKIIDYGRSYFNDDITDSMKVYEEVCQTAECGVNMCGVDVGYYYLSPEKYKGSSHYITSQKKNISHDLRLLNFLKNAGFSTIYPLDFMLATINYEDKFGTNEIEHYDPNKINNVNDAFEALEYIVNLDIVKNTNNHIYMKMKKIGDLHIYDDGRPMEFTKSKM